MILLTWRGAASSGPRVVFLFGSGLVGGAVARAMRWRVAGVRARHFDWSWPTPPSARVADVVAAARAAIDERRDACFAVIWAAGRSGFGSTEMEMEVESEALEGVMAAARCVGGALAPARRAFVHVSSAGGLFEGQVACDRVATPAPLRPYGHGKLAQERSVAADVELGHRLILRPSSVYGYARNGRQGLVSALVAAGIQHRDATIFGALTTQRDFVFAPDIGRYVAARMSSSWPETPLDSPETALLAAGRPASVFEVIQIVEDYLGKALRLRIDPRPENARDNTFLPSALPHDFQPTGLREGIALTATAVSQERYGGARP